jgi:hypothetical protein
VVQWSKALHRSASCATSDPGLSPGSVTATGRPMGQRTIGPASPGLGEGVPGREVLVPSHTGGPGTVRAGTVFPPTHWCGWLPG